MIWQDWVLAIGTWFLIIGLISAIRATEKPPLTTSIIISCVLWIFAGTVLTLGLVLSSVSTAIEASLWTVLFLQKWR